MEKNGSTFLTKKGRMAVNVALVCGLERKSGIWMSGSVLLIQLTSKSLSATRSRIQWYLMSMDLERFCLHVLDAIPAAVLLSVYRGVGGWIQLSSLSV